MKRCIQYVPALHGGDPTDYRLRAQPRHQGTQTIIQKEKGSFPKKSSPPPQYVFILENVFRNKLTLYKSKWSYLHVYERKGQKVMVHILDGNSEFVCTYF